MHAGVEADEELLVKKLRAKMSQGETPDLAIYDGLLKRKSEPAPRPVSETNK
jgi:hypothetical protein